MEYIDYDTFKKLDIRVGTILEVAPVPDADKLLVCQVSFGEEKRQIVSGIKEYYPDFDALVGKQVLYIVNLEPRIIRGFESQGMLMAVDGLEGAPVFLVPEVPVSPGTRVR